MPASFVSPGKLQLDIPIDEASVTWMAIVDERKDMSTNSRFIWGNCTLFGKFHLLESLFLHV